MGALGIGASIALQRRSLRPGGVRLPIGAVGYGLVAASALLGFYLGLITLAQGWTHALDQLAEDRWFIGAITVGFGTQVGLFSYLRGLRARAAMGGLAASTGTSTTAMLACCAHHLAEVLPVLGLSGAAIVLDLYKTPLVWVGIAMNLAGIVYLLRQIHRSVNPGIVGAADPLWTEQKESTMHPLSIRLVTMTTTVFAALAYLACVVFQPLFPNLAMYTSPMWAASFPGFSWTFVGVLVGLVEVALYAAISSAVYAWLYNFFGRRLTHAKL
jgi:hypothetical protein